MIKTSLLEVNKGQIEGLPKNPRFIRDTRFEQLKKSIQDAPEMLGLRELIVMPHGKKYVVIGGNMRLRACIDLGYNEIPCKVLDKDTPAEKLREYAVKDNNGFGQDDWDALANEWDEEELKGWGMEFPTEWGFEEENTSIEPNDTSEDDFSEDDEVISVRCHKGDVWQLGNHRLMCGDSIELEEVKRLMGGGIADLLLTDPPYNVNYEGGTDDKLKIQNDNMSSGAFTEFLTKAFTAADSVMKKGAVYYLWHALWTRANFAEAMKSVGWDERQYLIWNKNSLVLGRSDYQWKHEPCFYGWKNGAGHYFFDSRAETTVITDRAETDPDKMKKDELVKFVKSVLKGHVATDVMDFDRPTANIEHPTMKPVRLIGYLMRNSSRKGDTVLDIFGGSGTTLIAAEQLGRKCRMMELDPHYCDVIIARWEKLTGRKAELLTRN